jgi:hypothetical protein
MLIVGADVLSVRRSDAPIVELLEHPDVDVQGYMAIAGSFVNR